MANEEKGPDDFLSENSLTVDNINNEGASLESTSAESESASTEPTKIETISLSTNQINPKSSNAKEAKTDEDVENQPSSSRLLTSTLANYEMKSGVVQPEINLPLGGESSSLNASSSISKFDTKDSKLTSFESEENDDGSQSDETVSSEAMVDDIELILFPETIQDFLPCDVSPQLVRVTELKRSMDYDADVFEDDETDQESDFKRFGTDDEDISEKSVSTSTRLRRQVLLSSAGSRSRDGNENRNDDSSNFKDYARQKKSTAKINSGVQTEITALETSSASSPFELKRGSSGKSSGKSSVKMFGMPGSGKRLNWKSELTLLPSKTKIRPTGFSGYDSMNYQDQYSPRVAKFTSQDTLSSQFLKPRTLYRTRNLSRNLNQCDSSSSTLALSAAGLLPSTSNSARYGISSSTSTNFKESYSSQHISSSSKRQPLAASGLSVSFRSSLPDLSVSPRSRVSDNKGHFKSMKHHKSSSGSRLAKKSSSDDETSSLIDESERCLRSSIDLLLTDDLPSPSADFSCRSTGFRGGGSSTTASHGYYSSRRSYSQPVLNDDDDNGDQRDTLMGSPFLPRKLSDMRCSRWAKVILPNGHVAVVAVKEMDELKDILTIHTDTGCMLTLPFRKVVFAWKIKR